jgi:hypothetical protein
MVDVYRRVLGNCDKSSLRIFPHYGLPGHNLHEKVEVEHEDSSRNFPYSCMHPLPLLPPSNVSSTGEEMLCISLIMGSQVNSVVLLILLLFLLHCIVSGRYVLFMQ